MKLEDEQDPTYARAMKLTRTLRILECQTGRRRRLIWTTKRDCCRRPSPVTVCSAEEEESFRRKGTVQFPFNPVAIRNYNIPNIIFLINNTVNLLKIHRYKHTHAIVLSHLVDLGLI